MLPPNPMSSETPPASNSRPPLSGATTPLISVIIVCKDPGPKLKEALASVWAQIAMPSEIIVVDGGSDDGSRVWLASQRARLGTLIMEPDQGVYEAMNKGLAVAKGDWVLFLGADDKLYHDAVLNRASSSLRQAADGVVVGEAAYTDGRIYRLAAKPNAAERNFVHHQAAFYRRSLFTEHGNFDATLKIMGDYDTNAKLLKKGVKFTSLALRISTCGVGGLSDAGGWAGYQEEITVRHRYFPGWKCWLWDLGSVIRFVRKMFVKKPHQPH